MAQPDVTGADVPPLAAEAREAGFAAWYQAHAQQAGCDAVTHDAWQAGWAAGSAFETERIVQLVHLLRVLHKPVKETFTGLNGTPGVFIRCHGCDLGPHPEDHPDWPCSTAELVFTPEEITSHDT